jgi:hypothetical protein
MYQNEYPTLLESCWCFHNGDVAMYEDTPYGNRTPAKGWGGNGNGIKMGGNSTYGARNIAVACVVADHHYVKGTGKGFDQNDNRYFQTVLNCLSFDNWKNYSLNNGASDGAHIVKNNVSLRISDYDNFDKHVAFGSDIVENNNWNLGLLYDSKNVKAVTDASGDYESLDVLNDGLAPREADGSLPANGFARLKAGSVLLDQGQIVSYSFSGNTYSSRFAGTAPDLGPYEYDPEATMDPVLVNKTDGSNYSSGRPTGIIPLNWEAEVRKMSCVVSGDFITVFFRLPKTERIDLSLYSISGQKIKNLAKQSFPKGENFCTVPLSGLPQGVYICKLECASGSENAKIIVSYKL